MEQSTQIDLIRRLLALADEGAPTLVDSIATNPVSDYLDPDQFARERAILFREYPMVVGLGGQLRNPGDFLTHEDTGLPILVVRNRNGDLRAFVNACRHRGAMLAGESSGTDCRAFTCPYHGWVYDLDGRLTGIPESYGFEGLDRASHGLVALAAEERHGLIWVLPKIGARLDLDAYLGALDADFRGYRIEDMTHFRTVRIPVRMNWKLLFDTFLEIYHFPVTHGKTLGPLFMKNLAVYDHFDPHGRFVTTRRSFAGLREQDEAQWNLLAHCIVSTILFPNTVINYVSDHAVLFRVFPQGNDPAESLLYFTMFVPANGTAEQAQRHWVTNFNLTLATLHEDLAIGQRIQRTLASGANEHLTFGRFEPLLGWYHDAVRRALAES